MPSKIEWTDETWNPITGCSKISPGCANCYAERMAMRLKAMGRPEYQDAVNGDGKWTGKITLVPERLDQPLHWRMPRMVFVNSMSDLFHEDVPSEFIYQVFARMILNPRHIYQVLTKRPERMVNWFEEFRPEMRINNLRWPLANVWLGITIESQQAADERIPLLLQIPAAVRFLSCEPLLGPIDLELVNADGGPLDFARLHELRWVIVGGESGSNARPMYPEWVRSLRDQCQAAGIPFFFKQWGSAKPDVLDVLGWERAGRDFSQKKGGRLLDGCTWDQMPTDDGPMTIALGAGGKVVERDV